MCEWGSADTGRGKAARETRRLALIPAGTFDRMGKFEAFDDVESFEAAGIGFMKLPVTSVKGYAAFVKQIAGALKRPPHGVFTRIKVVPDPNSQFKVTFEPLAQVPDEIMGVIMQRHEEAKATIETPYPRFDEEAEKKPARGRGGKAAPPARGAKAPPAKAAGRAKRY